MPVDLIQESMAPLANRVAKCLALALVERSEQERERVLGKLQTDDVEVLRYGDRVALIVAGEPVTVVATEELI
jgi:hypothetical protein